MEAEAEFTPRPESDIHRSRRLAIQPSSNGRYLRSYVPESSSNDETPFFWLADTAWELFHRLDKDEAEKYLLNRAQKGFNVVMAVIMAEHNGLEYPSRAGHFPFLPTSNSGDPYRPDFTRPNPAFFEFVDWVVQRANGLGLIVALVPTWGRYINGGYYNGPYLFEPTTAHALGRFLGQRYPFSPFVLGGDSNRFWDGDFNGKMQRDGVKAKVDIKDSGAITEAMAQGLIEGEHHALSATLTDNSYETFIVYHSAQIWLGGTPETSGSAQFPDASWLTMDAVQTGHFDCLPLRTGDEDAKAQAEPGSGMNLWRARSSYVPIRKMFKTMRPDGRPRPVVDLEPHYEATHHFFQYDKPIWNADDIRKGAWQGWISGGCGITYGCNSIWQMHNPTSKTHPPIAPPVSASFRPAQNLLSQLIAPETPQTTAYTPWYLELDLPGAVQVGIAKRIIMSYLPPDTLLNRIPDQSFIKSPVHDCEPGLELTEPAGDKLICGTRDADGAWALVQLPYGGEVQLDLANALNDTGEHKGTGWRAWWIDPRSGGRSVTNKEGNISYENEMVFTAPDEQDWLLLVERAK